MTKKKKKWVNKEKEGKVRERNNKLYIYILIPLSYSAQPKMAMRCS